MRRYLRRPLTAVELAKAFEPGRPRVGNSPLCDFCGERSPMFVYASSVMSTGQPIRCWRWCACSLCDSDLQTGNWSVLLKRTFEVTKHALGRVFELDFSEQMYIFDSIGRMYVEFMKYAIEEPE